MRVSFNWLREYVDIDISPDELGDALTMAGLEVESIIKIDPDLNNVVIGRIMSIENHPNADKLSLCRVTTGGDSYSIVCGAGNIKVNDTVPLALEGAVFPNGMKIKKTKIRGEFSEGMICSEQELQIGEDTQGIMILDGTLELGEDIASALQLKDHIFELDITPNRPDCLSIIGVAREIAAITGKTLKMPEIELREEDERIGDLASVEIKDPELCPRYAARLIRGLTVGTSPFWLRQRLESAGIRPISNVVDVTNYVLMEFGQPLHAFDMDLLSQRKIIVKRASEGDIFTSLDGEERPLFDDTLMICDGEKAVAIGGVMGGLNSEVSEDTTCVLIESAYFNPSNIRKTSKKLGLQTEASYRFERGIDLEGVLRALNRSAQLMVNLCGGTLFKGAIDQYPSPVSQMKISLSVVRTNKILGTSLTKDQVSKYLKSIELGVQDSNGDRMSVTVPSGRIDLSREIDLIEEVARLNGYDSIPTTTPMVRVASTRRRPVQVLEYKVKDLLTSIGCYEVVNYSFISPSLIESLHLDDDHPYQKFIKIKNPLSEDQAIMRTTLIPGLLKTIKTNIHNSNPNLKLFELGTVFYANREDKLPLEKKILAAVITGLRYDESWNYSENEVDFYDIKGILENLLKGVDVREFSILPIRNIPYLHPGKSSSIMIGQTEIGFLGEVRIDVLESYEISKAVYIFEIDVDSLARHAFNNKKVKPISKYPATYRDIALIVDENVEFKEIYDTIAELSNKLVADIHIFDVYRGEPIPQEKKSLAYRIKYQSYERTLTDKEVNKIHEKLVSDLVRKVGATIRK
ncbi:MAG: phenylalanine--tRNA ligase subunit beta [Thermodesulfobacteriota bacterium]|nr:phenylalanine--tRNA ligase subunit beta [Thermodesulfobacteriota bacterium]